MLLLVTVEKVYYRHVGEYSQRQGHLGESRVDMTLSHVRRGAAEERDRRGRGKVQQPRGPKEQG